MFKQTQNSDIEWDRLQEMANNMLDAAKASDWEMLIELNTIRQPILDNYFIHIAPTLDSEMVRDRIHVLQAMELQMLQYSQSMRAESAQKLKSIHRGKRVEQAYSTHAAA